MTAFLLDVHHNLFTYKLLGVISSYNHFVIYRPLFLKQKPRKIPRVAYLVCVKALVRNRVIFCLKLNFFIFYCFESEFVFSLNIRIYFPTFPCNLYIERKKIRKQSYHIGSGSRIKLQSGPG